eukprot:5864682-Amphidinium_carterae.1
MAAVGRLCGARWLLCSFAMQPTWRWGGNAACTPFVRDARFKCSVRATEASVVLLREAPWRKRQMDARYLHIR